MSLIILATPLEREKTGEAIYPILPSRVPSYPSRSIFEDILIRVTEAIKARRLKPSAKIASPE